MKSFENYYVYSIYLHNSVKSDYASLQIMYFCQSYHGILCHYVHVVMLLWHVMFYNLLGNQQSFL